AMSESMPSLKVTIRLKAPSLVHRDDIYTMPSTPLTCSSMGAATVSRTVAALAPGYTVVTKTAGGVTFGYCVIGKVNTATPPASTMTSEMTTAKIGRSI